MIITNAALMKICLVREDKVNERLLFQIIPVSLSNFEPGTIFFRCYENVFIVVFLFFCFFGDPDIGDNLSWGVDVAKMIVGQKPS